MIIVCTAAVTKRRDGRLADTSRNESRKPPKAHAQARNVSPRKRANNTTQQQRPNTPTQATTSYSSYNRLPGRCTCTTPGTALHNACHKGGGGRQARPSRGRGRSGNRPRLHTDQNQLSIVDCCFLHWAWKCQYFIAVFRFRSLPLCSPFRV